MADPLLQEDDPTSGLAQDQLQAIDSLMATPVQPEQEQPQIQPTTPTTETPLALDPGLDSLMGQKSSAIPLATQLMQLRDDPDSIDLIGKAAAVATKKGRAPFSQESLADANVRVDNFWKENLPKVDAAKAKGDWVEVAKIAALAMGKGMQTGLEVLTGETNENIEKTQRSMGARLAIGNIQDPEQAAKAIELQQLYSDQLSSGVTIAPENQKPSMGFGVGDKRVKIGMNLKMAEDYLKQLKEQKNINLGVAGLRNFAVQSGDAFLPFTSVGDVFIDNDRDPDQVARRAALVNEINDTIYKNYGFSTMAGQAAGSVGQFIAVGGLATKLLGQAAVAADGALVKVPTTFSRGATYATVGASQSFEGDPRDLNFWQRLSSITSETMVLALAEGAGNKLEDSIEHGLSNYIVAKGLSDKIPALIPLASGAGKVLGTTIGETASEELEAVLRAQDPVEPFFANLGTSFGVGIGMAALGGSFGAAAKLRVWALADDKYKTILTDMIANIDTDPYKTDEQKQEEHQALYDALSPRAKRLYETLQGIKNVDPQVAPETYAAMQEMANQDKADVALDALQQAAESQKQTAQAEAAATATATGVPQGPAQPSEPGMQIGEPRQILGTIPEGEEENIQAVNELVSVFEKTGGAPIVIENTPANKAKIDWVRGQGRIYAELTDDEESFVILGVRDDAGDWIGEPDPIEHNQDLKDAIDQRIDELVAEGKLTEDRAQEAKDQLWVAGTDDEIEAVAEEFIGRPELQVAYEKLVVPVQEATEEEKAREIKLNKIRQAIVSLEDKLNRVDPQDVQELQDQIDALKKMEQDELGKRQNRGEQSINQQVNEYEKEYKKEYKAGKYFPQELEEQGSIVLAINIPGNSTYEELRKLPPVDYENDPAALGKVFDLTEPRTVEWLQSIGAINENMESVMSPVEAATAFLQRKRDYLNGRSLSKYHGFSLADAVYNASIDTFLLELRRGRTNISMSSIFNRRLKDGIRKAVPRLLRGVDLGAAQSFEAPKAGALDIEALAEEQGIDASLAASVNEALDIIEQIDADMQVQAPSDMPSTRQRQEALSIIAQNMIQDFRNNLKTDAEKLAFDALIGGKMDVAAEARKINTSVDNINVLQSVIQARFRDDLIARYQRAAEIGALPSRPVLPPDSGPIRAGSLTNAQMEPVLAKYQRAYDEDFFNQSELEYLEELKAQALNTRRIEDLNAFEQEFSSIVLGKLLSIDDLVGVTQANLDNAKDTLGEKAHAENEAIFNALKQKYESEIAGIDDIRQTAPFTRVYRRNLIDLNEKIDREASINEQGETNEETGNEANQQQQAKKPAGKPELSTEDRRKAARERAEANRKSKREAAATGKLPGKADVGQTVAGTAPSKAAKPSGPTDTRPYGPPIIKGFVQSLGLDRLYKLIKQKILGDGILQFLDENQQQDLEASLASMDGSIRQAFYLANGAGTGKTRVLLAVAKYYLDKGFNVIYLTASDAVSPDWANGKIGGSIEADAKKMGIPIDPRGSVEGKPIERTPGKILVSTYEQSYLEKIKPLVDSKTVVIFDEQHAGRNLHKNKPRSIIMDQIATQAGKVLMASGTPFETPAQLLSLRRLGLFDTEDAESLLYRLGFEKKSLRGGRAFYWDFVDGVTEEDMQSRMEQYTQKLADDGIIRSRSLKLTGVPVSFSKVALTADQKQSLQALSDMYGGLQNGNIAARRQLITQTKRMLEEFKVNAAVDQAIDAIRRGRKPIIYVGFALEETQTGKVDPTAFKVVRALQERGIDASRIARMYTKGDGKSRSMELFNTPKPQVKGDEAQQADVDRADVLVATMEMGGTGIELDDKYGNEPREMIIMSPPISAISAVQTIYRVWRNNTASYPSIVFLETDDPVDQMHIGRMRTKLSLLEAVLGAGFGGLRGKTEVSQVPKVIVRKAPESSNESEVKETQDDIKESYGDSFDGETITLRDSKGGTSVYNIQYTGNQAGARAEPGVDDADDRIVLNPKRLRELKGLLGLEAFKKFLPQSLYHEIIHIEVFRYFRELGMDPVSEITAFGSQMSKAYRLATSRLYHSHLGSDINSPEIQARIADFAADPYKVGGEAIRQMIELDLTGSVTEQVVSPNAADIARATARLQDIMRGESKSLLARAATWLDSYITTIKKGLGLMPNARDRLILRQGVQNAIEKMTKKRYEYVKLSSQNELSSPDKIVSPTLPRPSNTFDGYDLRIYRMIENHLAGRTEGVFGVEAMQDAERTVNINNFLWALDVAKSRGFITKMERDLFRSATQAASMPNGRASLAKVANNALQIAEQMEEAGESFPVEALTPITTTPLNLSDSEKLMSPEHQNETYHVVIGPYPMVETSAPSTAKSVGNAVYQLFKTRPTLGFGGRIYTKREAPYLLGELKRRGYSNFSRKANGLNAPEFDGEKLTGEEIVKFKGDVLGGTDMLSSYRTLGPKNLYTVLQSIDDSEFKKLLESDKILRRIMGTRVTPNWRKDYIRNAHARIYQGAAFVMPSDRYKAAMEEITFLNDPDDVNRNVLFSPEYLGPRKEKQIVNSKLIDSIQSKMPETATITQVKGILASSGISSDEIKYSSVNDYLDGFPSENEKIQKSELVDYLNTELSRLFMERTLSKNENDKFRDYAVNKVISNEINYGIAVDKVYAMQDPVTGQTVQEVLEKRTALVDQAVERTIIPMVDRGVKYWEYEHPAALTPYELSLVTKEAKQRLSNIRSIQQVVRAGDLFIANPGKDLNIIEVSGLREEIDYLGKILEEVNNLEGIMVRIAEANKENYNQNIDPILNEIDSAIGPWENTWSRFGRLFDLSVFFEEGLNDLYNISIDESLANNFVGYEMYRTKFINAKNYKEVLLMSNASDFTSNHFPSVGEGYVAHYRSVETEDSTKDPGVYVEEFQSDVQNENRKLIKKGKSPFLAPYAKTYPLQLFKRALADAVAEGKSWVGWTTGETQLDRYTFLKPASGKSWRFRVRFRGDIDKNDLNNLSLANIAQVSITVHKDPGAERDYDDKRFIIPPTDVEAAIGVEKSKKFLSDIQKAFDTSKENLTNPRLSELAFDAIEDNEFIFRHDDISLDNPNGVGMKKFYDELLPKEVEKYIKKFNGKVVKSTLPRSKSALQEKKLRTNLYITPGRSPKSKVGPVSSTVRIFNTQDEVSFPSQLALSLQRDELSGKFYVQDRETRQVQGPFDTYSQALSLITSDLQKNLQENVEDEAGLTLEEQSGPLPFWKVDITPELKAQVQAGQALFSPEYEIRESRAGMRMANDLLDSIPSEEGKQAIHDLWYYESVPREIQDQDAQIYIQKNTLDTTVSQFLTDTINETLSARTAIGHALVERLVSEAEGDPVREQQLIQVATKLTRDYGTEPGRAVALWNRTLDQMAERPAIMRRFVDNMLNDATKGRMAGYVEEEAEIRQGMDEAARRASEALANDPVTQEIIKRVGGLIENNKRQQNPEGNDDGLINYVNGDDANAAADEFLGPDGGLNAPESDARGSDDIRLNEKQVRALGVLIRGIIDSSENPAVTAGSPREIRELLLMVPNIQKADQIAVKRKLDLYFDAALAFAIESRATPEFVVPSATRGEAKKRVAKVKEESKQEAPIEMPKVVGDRLKDLAPSAAESLYRMAERGRMEPKQKEFLKDLADRITNRIARHIKQEGGLPQKYEKPPRPTEAETVKQMLTMYPEVLDFITGIREELLSQYSEEERAGLEPLIEEAFNFPLSTSSLKQTIRTLASIGGPVTNLRQLIRSSRGDISTFILKMQALLTENTTLDLAQQKSVLTYLESAMATLLADERKKELERIRNRFERRKEGKTRKMRSVISKMMEAQSLGVFKNEDMFLLMRQQLGLPELKEKERKKLDNLIDDLHLYPSGSIRNRKISEMFQYIKVVAPQVWGDLIVSYQTANLLAGFGTVGINAWSAFISNNFNAAILGMVGAAKRSVGLKSGKAGLYGTAEFYSSLYASKTPWLAAWNVLKNGDYTGAVDVLSQELGRANIWEAILNQG